MPIPKEIEWTADSEKFDATHKGAVAKVHLFTISFDHTLALGKAKENGRWLLKNHLPIQYTGGIGNRFKELGEAEGAADKILLYFWCKITNLEEDMPNVK